MLSPDARAVAMELLRPPQGYRLDLALLTTYTLDLEALLALPLGVLAQADGGIEELLADPLLLLEALQEAGNRIHVFVDQSGIAIPRTHRDLYAMLESSVHPVRVPNGGAFHPKVWVARFLDYENENEPPLLRVAVLSRNLTFDHSWDVALASEAPLAGKRRVQSSRPLGDLLRRLSEITTMEDLAGQVKDDMLALAEEVDRTRFPSPDGFEDPVVFHALGLSKRRISWCPKTGGSRLLAIAPFVSPTAIDSVIGMSGGEHMLVSRQEELDKLSDDALANWSQVLVLQEAELDEAEDEASTRPIGLHAKIIVVEHGWDVTWYVGSANLTMAAFTGRNIEMMAAITGRKGRRTGNSGHGIERFLDAGFRLLCRQYRRSKGEEDDEDNAAAEARNRLEDAQKCLLASPLSVVCESMGDGYTLKLKGEEMTLNGVHVVAWPVSVAENHYAKPLELPLTWSLPIYRLTAFVAFHLSVPYQNVEDIRLTRKLPTEGMPEGRISEVLQSLIDSPERFLQFLRALLGGLEGMVDWAKSSDSNGSGSWGDWSGGETLLEDLMRVASREPSRLEPIRRLIDGLRETEDGREIVPNDLLEVWDAVDEAIRE